MRRRLITSMAAVLAVGVLATTASAEPNGYVKDELPFGNFYQDFAGTVVTAGGTAAEFCTAEDRTPGSAPVRLYFRNDGSVDMKVNTKDVPIHLYETDLPAPLLINATCDALFDGDPTTEPLEPFASGTADLKVRISDSTFTGTAESEILSGDVTISNSVNGKAVGVDGGKWKVRAWAKDFSFVDGELQDDPTEFVGAHITRIGR